MSSTIIVTIDPGANGGIAWRWDGKVSAEPMPDSLLDIWDLISSFKESGEWPNTICYLENVGQYRKGNSGPAAVKFAEHVGGLKMALAGLEMPSELVAPGTWMKRLGSLPKDKTARKNAIKAKVQARFPHLKVTLKTADALGMLMWAMDRLEVAK